MNDAVAELRELCDKYAEFSADDLAGDRGWLRGQIRKGTLDGVPIRKYLGKLAAAYEGKLVLIGDDETTMRVELSKIFEVHPGRFALLRVEKYSAGEKAEKATKAAALGCSIVNVVVVLLFCALVGLAAIYSMGTKSNATFSKIGSTVN